MANRSQTSYAPTGSRRRGSTASVELDPNNIVSGKRQRKESRRLAEASASEAENLPDQKKPKKSRTKELVQEARPAVSTQPKSTAPPTKTINRINVSTKNSQVHLQTNSPLATTRKSTQYRAALATSCAAEEPGYYSDDGIKQSAQRMNGMSAVTEKLMAQELFESEMEDEEMPLAQPSSTIDLTHEKTSSSSSLESNDEEIQPQKLEKRKELSKVDKPERFAWRKQRATESQNNEDHIEEYGLQPVHGRFHGFTLTQLEFGLPVRYLFCGHY